MQKLLASIRKDFLILLRDKVGVTFMIIMPVLLVLIITSLQNNAFELVNKQKAPLLISNMDEGAAGNELIESIEKIGMFTLLKVPEIAEGSELSKRMHKEDALLAIFIPKDFSSMISNEAAIKAQMAFNFSGTVDTVDENFGTIDSLRLYYNPVLQENYRMNIRNGLHSAMRLVETKYILKHIRQSLGEESQQGKDMDEVFKSGVSIVEIPVSKNMTRSIPDATQHNIPAWTIFAMFFIVISLGSSLVKEKLSGSHLRLKTMPSPYLLAMLSRLIVYTLVCLAQVVIVFSLGVFLFPHIGLAALVLPYDLAGLFVVSLVTAVCAVSYAICIGIFAQTQEQANGFGAVSVVILASVGGILVPSFAMPDSFRPFMMMSPLHWSLESYYILFLEKGKLSDVWGKLIPLLSITLFFQLLAFAGLKKQKLI